jgi:hypothetical protein
MNWAHVHLIINHIPELGVMGGILLLVYAIVRKSEEVTMLSFLLFALVAIATIAVFMTGHGAEDVVKNLPGVTEAYIGQHEEMASVALIGTEILGILCIIGLVLLRRSGAIPRWLVITVLVVALIDAGAVGFTTYLGGQIRHTEIRSDAAAVVPSR